MSSHLDMGNVLFLSKVILDLHGVDRQLQLNTKLNNTKDLKNLGESHQIRLVFNILLRTWPVMWAKIQHPANKYQFGWLLLFLTTAG